MKESEAIYESEAVYKEVQRGRRQKIEYYKAAFSLIDSCGKYIWNWPAFFFGEVWALYRKMCLYSFLGVILLLILHLLFDDKNVLGFFGILYKFLWGRYGNALYYRTIKKKIERGYHLMDDHRATSFWGGVSLGFGLVLMPLVDYFLHEKYFSTHKLKDNKATEENIERYFDPNKEHHNFMNIAIVIALIAGIFLAVRWGFFVPEKRIQYAENYNENTQKRPKLREQYEWPVSAADVEWLAREIKSKFKTEDKK